jgi:SAM-dependent methyltransferase
MLSESRDARIRAYWEDPASESMYDKYLAALEAEMIARHVRPEDRVLDLGCGDGTGSQACRGRCASYVGLDRSQTMLTRFATREVGSLLIQGDLRALPVPRVNRPVFTSVLTQRALINLPDAAAQEEVLRRLPDLLTDGGRLLLCEAFHEGVERLNALRVHLGCELISPKWHNVHLDRTLTARVLGGRMDLIAEEDLSVYYLLTRVVHQALVGDAVPKWDSPINRIAFEIARSGEAPAITGYSTIVLQVWQGQDAE